MGADPPATAPGLPAGPTRFRCPEDFCARPFAFCPAGAPGKRLLLIRAPADFRPESLSGRRLALRGSPLLRASQPDGSQKVYGLQATWEESAARLLIAAGRPERLTCARPFGGTLRIQERDGEPGASRQLFPVAERPPPRVPAGLKQRFFPFGARLKGPPRKADRQRGSKKRTLLPWKQALLQPEGPEPLLGGSPEPGGARAGSKQRPLKEEAAVAATGPAVLPGLGGRLPGHDAQPSGLLEEASPSEEPGSRRARKKERKRKAGLEAEELPNPSSRYWQPEARLQGGREPEGGGGKAKKKKAPEAGAEGLWGVAAIKEEPVGAPCLGSLAEEKARAIGEESTGEDPRWKKKKRRRSRERSTEELWGDFAVKEEPGDAPCLGGLPEERLGSPREEPGRELAGYIKQSPGKGAGGLWGTATIKEEPGDDPSLGRLAEESLGVSPEDPAGEGPSCKKKKKKRRRSRERAAEGLWGTATIKEEPRDGSLGSLAEESLGSARGGPAGELLACRKKKKKGGKLDKEPLQEQGTGAQHLESNVLDWAAPLWPEAGPEEPWQTSGAAPDPRPKKKKGSRREKEGQAGLFAAGT